MNESKPIAAYRKYIPAKRQAELGVLPEKLTIAEIASLHPDGDAFAKLLLAAHDVFLNHGYAQHYGPDIHPPPDPKFGKGLPGEHLQGRESLDIILSFPKEDPPWEPDPSAGDIRNALLISVYRDDLRAWLQEIGLSLPEDALLRAWWPGEKASPAISIEDALTREQLRQIELRWLFKVLELTTRTTDPFEVLTALLGRGLDLTAQVGDQGDEQRVRPKDVSAALAEAEREYRALQDAIFDGTAIDEWKREAEIWKRPVAVGGHHMALGELRVSELGYAAACSRLGLSAYHWPKVHWPQALADLDERKCSEAPPYVRMRAWRPGEIDPPASADAGPAGAGDAGSTETGGTGRRTRYRSPVTAAIRACVKDYREHHDGTNPDKFQCWKWMRCHAPVGYEVSWSTDGKTVDVDGVSSNLQDFGKKLNYVIKND